MLKPGVALLKSAGRSAARRLVGFVVAHPRLDFFLRRQINRFPGLSRRARSLAARSRQHHWEGQAPVRYAGDEDLPEPALLVLAELRRAVERTRSS